MLNKTVFIFALALCSAASPAQDSDEHAMDSKGHHMDHSAHMEMASAPPMENVHGLSMAFKLTGAKATDVSLEDFKGNYLLVGFGFTHCDYVCPTMAANIARVIKQADSPTRGVFISVDTERDTPDITHRYAQQFDKRLVGLSGSHNQISDAANNFKVSFAVTKTQKNYTVLHTASIFLIGPDSKLIDVFALNASTEEILSAIKPEA